MDCERFFELLYVVVDEDPDFDTFRELRLHLTNCPECARRALLARRVVTLVRERCHREQAPERLRLRILGSFPHRRRPSPS
jgi:mycothiol system anti-sigma-R factor